MCEGSGIEANLASELREVGVPLHIYRLRDQEVDTPQLAKA